MGNLFLKIFLITFCLFNTISLFSQNESKYKKVDEFVRLFKYNPSNLSELKVLANEYKRKFHTSDELVRAAFVWIADNISYDCNGYNNNNFIYEVKEVLRLKKGVCSGYANLLEQFCKEFNIECTIVIGFVKGVGVSKVYANSLNSNHAWNAVKIENEWKLIDPTWGSGSSSDDNCSKFIKEFKEQYFYCKPEELIKTHFPDSSRWQLLNPAYTAVQFADSIKKRNEIPKDSIIKKNVGEIIKFTFSKLPFVDNIMISICDIDHQVLESLNDTLQYDGNNYFYNFKVKRTGKYRINLYTYNSKANETEATLINNNSFVLHVPTKLKTIKKLK